MKRFNYSEDKFCGFDSTHQTKIIIGIIGELDRCIGIPERVIELKELLTKYRTLLKTPLPPKIASVCDAIALAETSHSLLNAVKPFIDTYIPLRKDDQIVIRTGDGIKQTDPELASRAKSVAIVLDNLRSVFNVGSIFRIAECLALGELVLCGITPTPDHPNMNKTAMNTCNHVKWSYHSSTVKALNLLRERGYRLYALETAENSVSIHEVQYHFPLALVLGNEALGIDPQVLPTVDEIISVPVLGWKNSLNVGVALAVTAYQIIFD